MPGRRPTDPTDSIPGPPGRKPTDTKGDDVGGQPGRTPTGGGDEPVLNLKAWDTGVPLLLMPIRIETAYATVGGRDELRIRILPDPATVAGAPPPSAGELAEGQAYWRAHHAATSPAERAAAWRQYARRLGSQRAGYVARLTEPTVANGRLTFPDVEAQADTPGFARLLPERWLATGWVGDTVVFEAVGNVIAKPLPTSPDSAAVPAKLAETGLAVDPAIAWLFDYDVAVENGMAISVPLVGTAAKASGGLSTLVVVGVDPSQRPDAAAADLTELLDQHTRSGGLAFVPQGTPTNNTDTVASGYRREETELADLQAREYSTPRPSPDDNASRLATALGLANDPELRRLAHGTDQEGRRSRDMRTALFQPVLGTYVGRLLATHERDSDILRGGWSKAATTALRTWFVQQLTGGAPVPTLRIGRQPYGILPVLPESDGDSASETARRVAETVALMQEEWRAAITAVPTLDHNATDLDGSRTRDPAALDAEVRDAVTAVLANNPHPRRLTVRTAKDWADQSPPFAGGMAMVVSEVARLGGDVDVDPIPREITGGFRWEYDQAVAAMNDRYRETLKPLYEAVVAEVVPNRPDLDDIETVPRARIGDPMSLPGTEADIRGVEEQLEVWYQIESAIDDVFSGTEMSGFLPELHIFAQDMIEQLTRHELRQRPLRWLDVPDLDGVLGRDDLQLLLTSFAWGDRLWQRAVVEDEEPPAGVTAAVYLRDLADRLGTPNASALPAEFLAAAPLLFQLLEAVNAISDDVDERKAALRRLAAASPDELDWLLRETLGLGTHRLDAWHTSLASERLATLRASKSTGLHVGSFGFVLDLDRSAGRASSGFVHAPSLAHAASAAVLRSGWLARGGATDSPAAIDVSSARVRQADWFLSGVRAGQDLGDLLGARFERALHDAFLDVAIRPLRLAVAQADGLGETAADQPVDGIRLLEVHRDGGLAATITELDLPERRRTLLLSLIGGLDAAFDAIDDVTTFEAVHQLVAGNLERAAAVLDGMGPNGGAPPELLGVRTPRTATTIDTRALVLIDAAASSSGWPTGTRDRFDPALDAWVAAMLPPPHDVGFVVVTPDGSRIELRLDSVPICALDAVILAEDNPQLISPAFRHLVELAHPAETFVELSSTSVVAPVSLSEFQTLALELRNLVQESAPADERALLPADVLPGEGDVAATVQRAASGLAPVGGAYGAVAAASAWTDLPLEHAIELARLGLTPAPVGDPAADFAAMQERLARRSERADAVADQHTIAGMRDRVAALLGVAAPLLVQFPVPESGLAFPDGLAEPDEVDAWIDVMGSVRPRVGPLSRAVLLSGLLGVSAPPLAAGQWPLRAGEPWVALHQPESASSARIASAALMHGSVASGSQVVGLVVDTWAERIPAADQMTGVAFSYDGPSTEAPQSMLLVVAPEGRAWSSDLVLAAVLETIEWAQLRSVAIDDLGDYGHALPTVLVPDTLAPAPEPKAAS